MSVFCITQARMGSSRLPGKVLREIHGRPMLEYHMRRVGESRLIDSHIVATTTHEIDAPIVEYCQANEYAYYCGDEDDVLGRFYCAAKGAGAKSDDLIIRLTGDCPLISAELIDDLITMSEQGSRDNYSHVSLKYFPRGFDAEVFSMKKLEEANTVARSMAQREHVTLYMYSGSGTSVVPLETGNIAWSQFRLCVDELADLNLVDKVIEELGDKWLKASPKAICQLLIDNPHLAKINQTVKQRTAH